MQGYLHSKIEKQRAAWKEGSSVQPLSRVQLFATPCTAVHQASLSITNSWTLLKLMSIESVMLSNHFILCHPLSSGQSTKRNQERIKHNEDPYWDALKGQLPPEKT